MSSSRSSSASREIIGEKRSPTDRRFDKRPELLDTSSIAFDSEIERMPPDWSWYPADEYVPNQKHTLRSLPQEIRDQIFSLVAEPEFWTDEQGALRIDSGVEHVRRLPLEIRATVVSAYYRRRYLIIDLPIFQPQTLKSKFHNGIKQYTWPSEIHFHDQWNDLSFRTVPTFLSTSDLKLTRSKCTHHEDIRNLPLHLFKELVIKIPPSQPGDIAHFIMTWNRLRFLGRLLIQAVEVDTKREYRRRLRYGSKGLPPVRIVFLEDEQYGMTWFDKDEKLKASLSLPAELMLGQESEHSSDLLLLLRALAPVRGSNKFFVEPTLPTSLENLNFSSAWMAKNCTQKQRFGECMDMQWNDLLSFHWLTRFEIYLHGLLHNLDTPVAPFLRLEQIATTSHVQHDRISRYASRYKQTSEICKHADDIMTAIGSCAFALAPDQGRSLCNCLDAARQPSKTNDSVHECLPLGFGEYCSTGCRKQAWQGYFAESYQIWEDEFMIVRQGLLHKNGSTLTEHSQPGGTNVQSSDLPTTFAESEELYGYDEIMTKAWRVNNIRDPCVCFVPVLSPKQRKRKQQRMRRVGNPEAWIKAWPQGIVHEKKVIRCYRVKHECQQVRDNPNADGHYFCLDRSKRDENGLCNGREKNTSPPFLEQFAHLMAESR